MCQVLARAKKVYRCVEPAELEKIAGSVHHGGIVAVVPGPVWRSPTASDISTWLRRGDALVLLDRIGNAHNFGALARTAAFFGVPRIIYSEEDGSARPGDAAYRIAEGGLDHLEVWRVRSLETFIRELTAAGYEVFGAATRGGELRPRGASSAKPAGRALVLGNEEHGLSPGVAAACTRLVTIPGAGGVESLNVSVAGALLIWELLASRRQ